MVLESVAWIAVSVLAVVFTYGFLKRRSMRLLTSGRVPSRTERLLGRPAEVTQEIDAFKGTGRVLVEGEDWAAKSDDTISVGTRVIIVGADGIVLNVAPDLHLGT